MSKFIVMGIDPGTTTSATGIAVFCDGKLVMADEFRAENAKKIDLRKRIYLIGQMLDRYFTKIVEKCFEMPSVACIEESVYLGKANHNLQRLLGVLEYIIPPYIDIIRVNPITLKKYYGNYKYSKDEVYSSLLNKLPPDHGSAILKKAIKEGKEDIADAIAVAFYGQEKHNS